MCVERRTGDGNSCRCAGRISELIRAMTPVITCVQNSRFTNNQYHAAISVTASTAITLRKKYTHKLVTIEIFTLAVQQSLKERVRVRGMLCRRTCDWISATDNLNDY